MPEGREIERQFRLLRPAADIIEQARQNNTLLLSYEISQSYLADTGSWTIRVRRTQQDNLPLPSYEQTLKRTIHGIERIEEPISLDQDGYERILRHCGPALVKRRSEILVGNLKWEVDVFLNPELCGLELVEVELPAVDTEIHLPDWVGEETSHIAEYRNAALAKRLKC